ncbi:peptidylprolyl isomerase [Streptomyces sp. NPDC055085]
MTDLDLRAEPTAVTAPTREPERKARTGQWASTTAALLMGAVTCAGLAWSAVVLTQEKPGVPKAATSCIYTLSDPTKRVSLPSVAPPDSGRPYTVKLATSMGTVTFETLNGSAPCATNSFIHLARSGYYNNRTCPRLTTQNIFILECGTLANNSDSDPGYHFKDEDLPGSAYTVGTVAMSKAVAGQNGSRFFISYDNPTLPMPQAWTRFGRLINGLDVLKKIAANGTENGSSDGKPEKPVVIKSVAISND